MLGQKSWQKKGGEKQRVCAGDNVMILNSFVEKYFGQNYILMQKSIQNTGYLKNRHFCRKLVKLAENSDQSFVTLTPVFGMYIFGIVGYATTTTSFGLEQQNTWQLWMVFARTSRFRSGPSRAELKHGKNICLYYMYIYINIQYFKHGT
jgi:hypothetical protein